mgnify:CR=1 FL=1
MPNNKKRGDNVASSRSRLEKEKAVPKLRAGQAHQEQFLKLIQKMFRGINVDVMDCDKVPEIILDFRKKIKKDKLNVVIRLDKI